MGGRIPEKTGAVILGGGVAGRSVAYHLTRLGVSDVVLLECKQLTCTPTGHAAGPGRWPFCRLHHCEQP